MLLRLVTRRERAAGAAAEQLLQEAALLLQRRLPVLRAATIVAQLQQHTAARGGALRIAAVQHLELVLHLLEAAAGLPNLSGERAALRRRRAEQGEESGVLAAHAAGLRHQTIDLGLLTGGGFLRASNDLGAVGIVIATVERGELRFQPLTDGAARLRECACGGERKGGGKG